jgi:hypothetical protein
MVYIEFDRLKEDDARNCKKGIACGNSCIAQSKKCKQNLGAKAAAVADHISDPANLEEGAEKSGESEKTDEALLKDLKKEDPDFVEKWGTVDDEVPDPETGAKILNSDAPPPTSEQVANIQEYTGENYSYINESLRDTGRYDESEFEESGGKEYWQEKGRDITNALEAIPDKYEGVVYRGTSLPKELLEKMEVGGTYADKGLMSTTKELALAKSTGRTSEDSQQTVFVIKSQTGVDITKVSTNPQENEILFGAGKEFAINKMQMAGGILYIGLKEK